MILSVTILSAKSDNVLVSLSQICHLFKSSNNDYDGLIMCIRSETYETMTTTWNVVNHKVLDREEQRKWASQCRPVRQGITGVKPFLFSFGVDYV